MPLPKDKRLNSLPMVSAFVLFLVILSLALGVISLVTLHLLAQDNLRSSHRQDMEILSKQMEHNLKQRMEVIRTLAHNKLAADVLQGEAGQDNHDIRLALNTANEVMHSELIAVYDRSGTIVSSSDNKAASTTGNNYSFRPYVHQSLRGETAVFPAFGAVTRSRGLYLSAPVYVDGEPMPLGLIMLKIGIEEVEGLLKETEDPTAVVSPEGVIFASNQPGWLYHSIRPLGGSAMENIKRTRQFGPNDIKPLDFDLDRQRVTMDDQEYLVATVPYPVRGWRIVSCRLATPVAPIPMLHKVLLVLTLSVTGGLAVLVFFLLANIQRRRRTESRLRRAEEKYHGIFKNAAMGIFQSTLEGAYMEASPSLARILGYRDPQHLMESVSDIGRDVYLDPNEREAFIARLGMEQKIDGYETLVRRRDGGIIRVSMSCRLVSNARDERPFLEGSLLDITEQRRAEEALRREHAIVSRIMETSPLGIILADTSGAITFANSRAEDILALARAGDGGAGYAQPAALMTDMDGTPLSQEEIFVTRALPHGGQPQDARVVLERPGRDQVFLALHTAPLLDPRGRLTETVTIFEDISAKILVEREEAKRQQQLVQADRMISLGILTSGVAHEINNPNTFIMSNAQLFAEAWQETGAILDEYHRDNGDFVIGGLPYSKFREKVPVLCSRILEGAVRIQRIVKELRTYSRQSTVEALVPVQVNEVIQSAEILLGSMIRKCTDNFSLELADGLPLVRADFQRLEQVVINVVQNACQALTGPGRAIHVRTALEAGFVVLECRDQGVGIPENQLGHVTDPFFTTKRDTGGTGLGLSISLSIVREFGGSLEFDSRPGEGTTVRIRIPADISLPRTPTPLGAGTFPR
ncbi:ATP-binding protein [Desulfocurvus sp. DL9XJH121]